MTRTAAREIAVQLSFLLAANPGETQELLDTFFEEEYYSTLASACETFAEYPDPAQLDYIRSVAAGVVAGREELDALIQAQSKGWKVSRISTTAMAIMRVAVYEMLYVDDVPVAAAINEAVELDKGYDDAEIVAFLNGVLGGVARAIGAAGEEAPAED